MKNKKYNKPRSLILVIINSLFSVVMIVALVMTNMYSTLISNVLDAPTTKIINPVEDVYTSDFENYDALVSYEEEICKQVEAEGIVLLTNVDNALPLSQDIKNISIFGQDSVDFVYGGSGSGSVNTDNANNFKQALEAAGFSVNSILWDFYLSGAGSSYRKEYKTVTGAGQFAVNEVPQDVYTDSVKSSYSDYSDAAIVVLGRSGGESADLLTDSDVKYLQVDPNEEALIKMVSESFDTVIVVINSSNAMELGFLEKYNVDAAIWVGGVGQTGIDAIGEVLNGTVNPSGRLVDTYAYDSTSAPSYANLGSYIVTNPLATPSGRNDNYMVYSEGIYVGYRYYETRYEDVVLSSNGVGNYNYSSQVQFPFGYGLSYSTFTHDQFSVVENENDFTVSVNVTNTGSLAGKDVVEVYMQSPYTDYDKQKKIEKASVELTGFAKTAILEPGQSEVVTLSIPKESLKTYDTYGTGTYILDAGDYYFTIGINAHDALNNILSAKGYSTVDGMTADGNIELTYLYTVSAQDDTTYSKSLATGNPITNQFESVDINYYKPGFNYLSRSNWVNTWPETFMNGEWNAPDSFISDNEFYRSDEVMNAIDTMPITDQKPSDYLYVSDLIGVDYNDERWDTLVSELSLSNIVRLVRMGGYATISIDSIGLPATTDKDGPSGFSSSLIPGRSGMAYPAEVVMASTWNTPLIEEVGKLIGEDSLALKITGWYGPAMNIHRSPYSGRNFEYFSEDGFISGKMAASEISGALSKGVISYMKHFALNDQETNRTAGAIFANEQSIRELYLQPFELAVREGNANAAMAAMNRVGTRWVGAYKGLMTETLRNEWGFEGMVITDQASVPAMLYQDIVSGLYAGTDLWLNTNNSLWDMDEYMSNPTVMTNAANAAKNIIYTVANSNAMNGISPDTEVVSIMPWWQKTLFAIAAVVWALNLFVVYKFIRNIRLSKQI